MAKYGKAKSQTGSGKLPTKEVKNVSGSAAMGKGKKSK